MKYRIVSLYWNNVSERIVAAQRDTFMALGFKIEQYNLDGLRHSTFITEQLSRSTPETVLLVVDIDCIPINREAVTKALEVANSGGLYGAAQCSNHLQDTNHVFVAPCFMAIKTSTWDYLGLPSFEPDALNDVGQRLTRCSESSRLKTVKLRPEFCLIPKYRMGEDFPYGIGTFFESGIFHLYESRKRVYEPIFLAVAQTIINKKQIDYIGLFALAFNAHLRQRRKDNFKFPFRKLRAFFRQIRALSFDGR
jgi:hypothetical protein